MYLRRAIALAFALLSTLVTVRAHAWQEAHEVGDDVEMHVGPDGIAEVHHHLRWHVVHGPIKSIDLQNFEVDLAAIDPAVKVTTDDGRELSARVVLPPEGKREERAVRIEVDEPRSFLRGTFTFDVQYRVDWVASRALAPDGATWRLTWSAPVAVDGYDSARVTLDLPAAPQEPKVILADTGAVDDSAVTTLRREETRDVLDLVRPHVARGEAVTWTMRVDPRALPAVVDPRLRPPSRTKLPEEPNRVRGTSLAVALGGLALAFGLLVAHKTRTFARACAARGAEARALLPIPLALRALLAGGSLGAGVALQALDRFDRPTAGAGLVALAALAATLRGASADRTPRGPGRWLVLRPDDAFVAPRGEPHWLDCGGSHGRATLALLVALVGAAAYLTRTFDLRAPWLVAMDALALVPLFATGGASSLPPDGARSSAPWLSRAFARLRAIDALRVAPWVRAAVGGSTGDELRLLVLPRAATPGLVGIEVGLAWSPTPVGWAATPEVLVRALDRSPAAMRFSQAMPAARATLGRHADERVTSLRPRTPTRASTVALVRELADALTDRRRASRASQRAPEAQGERRMNRPSTVSKVAAGARKAAPPAVEAPVLGAASQTTPSC